MLDSIYKPVKDDLDQVEASLKKITDVKPKWLSQLLYHSLESKGKRIRPALVLLSGQFYDYDLSRLLPMAVALEVLHSATLVHDDAVDHSSKRRGRPTINKIWGEDKAILLGDYLLAKAEDMVSDTQSIRVVKLFARTIMTLASGELGQSFAAFDLKQNREQYINRIAAKTSSLIMLATESGAILSKAPEKSVSALRDYSYNLGIAFQVVDDILDFIGDEAMMGKPSGSDLSEGTMTLPSMMIMESYPGDNPVRRVFRKEGDKNKNIELAIELAIKSGAIDRCYEIAQSYSKRACYSLKVLPDNPARKSLEILAEYVVKRKK